MESTGGFIRYMNVYTNQIILPMLGEDDNVSDNFGLYEDEKSIPEAQDIEKDHRDLVGKSSDSGSCAKEEYTSQDGLLGSESSSSLKEVRFNKQEFPAGTLVFNIKYDYLRSQNDNLFYPFYNQLDYILAHYFAESETTKGNINKFPSNSLMAPLTEKLSYQNAEK